MPCALRLDILRLAAFGQHLTNEAQGSQPPSTRRALESGQANGQLFWLDMAPSARKMATKPHRRFPDIFRRFVDYVEQTKNGIIDANVGADCPNQGQNYRKRMRRQS